MRYCHAKVFLGEAGFVKAGFSVENGRFRNISPESGKGHPLSSERDADNTDTEPSVDLGGLLVLPGLVDMHIHGNSGCDFSDGSEDGLRRIGTYLASRGVTTFAPASMTLPYDVLERAFYTACQYRTDRPEAGARLAGIHMEGPFFSEKRRGAQNREYLKAPDAQAVFRLQEACGGLIRVVDIAPELPGAVEFIREVSSCCRVSAGHTDASYEEASAAFSAGASHVTHLFNAMPPLHHRTPGLIGAACEQANVTAELICDGLHIHPSVIRMAFRLFPGQICLISDAMRCCGMPDGVYELGGQQVTLKDRAARLSDGTLAGASSDLFEDMVNAIHFGIPVTEAVTAASLTPAEVLGAAEEVGSIEKGKKADFLVCDESWNLKQVYMDGIRIR
ncbi:MAG: N-acetylglucosamine-6-phosphate deacetylase [Blautia sp.]|nr:N-acetylglucosamine-6-phosphate deacetylase [Blautia sp.]